MSNIIITLSNSLDARSAERIGLPAEDLNPGTEVVVPPDVAGGLIGAGYATVEVENPREVAKALRRKAPAHHEVGLFVAPEEPQAQDSGQTADTAPKTNADPGPSGTQTPAKRGT